MRDRRSLAVVRLCAAQELTLALRSRWTQSFAAIFGVLTLAIAGSGYILSGGSGFQDFGRTAASLLQLVLLVVPLASIVMGVMALTPDHGRAELMFAQPVPRGAVLAGTLLGVFEAMAAAQALGFGAAGVVVFVQVGDEGVRAFLLVAASSLVLTAIFLSLAALVAAPATGRQRARALAHALIVWCVLAIAFDIVVLGVATMLRSGQASRLLVAAAVVNPIDAIRTGTLLGIEGTAAFGAASLAFLRLTGGPIHASVAIGLSVLLWIGLPLVWAARRLAGADIS